MKESDENSFTTKDIICLINRNFDNLMALASIIVSIFIFILYCLFGINQLAIGLVALASPFLYFILKNKKSYEISTVITKKKPYLIMFNIVFFIFYSASILSLHSHLYSRSAEYFSLIVACFFLIVFDIIFSLKKSIILAKLIFICFNIQYGIYFEYPGPLGIDTWYHEGWINKWLYFAHIVPGSPFSLNEFSGFSNYYTSPLFHLYIMISKLITGFTIKSSYFLVGLGATISIILIIYIISKKIYKDNDKRNTVPIFSAFFICLNPFFLQSVTQIIPMTLGVVYFAFLLYVSLISKKVVGFAIIYLLILFSLIQTHAIATIISFISILIIYFFINIYSSILNRFDTQSNHFISLGALLLFMISFVTQWLRESSIDTNSLFTDILYSFKVSLEAHAGFADVNNIAVYDLSINYFLNMMSYIILLLLGIYGLISTLSLKNRDFLPTILSAIFLILIIISYIFPLFGLQNIVPLRWFAFNSLILAIVASFGLVDISNKIKHIRFKIAFIIIIIFSTSLFSITSDISSNNDPVWMPGGNRVAYTQSELTALEKLPNIYAGKIYIDYMYTMYILKKKGFELGFINPEILNYEGLVILRDIIFTKGIYIEKSFGISSGPIYLDKKFKYNLSTYEMVYNNGPVFFIHS